MGLTLSKNAPVAVGLVAVLLIGNAAVAVRNTRQLFEDTASVAHTYEVLDLTGDVLRTLVDAETGERGFLITGNLTFLEPFNEALARLDKQVLTLQSKTEDNSQQQANITTLKNLIAARRALFDRSIQRRQKIAENDQAFVVAGKEKTDDIRRLIATMEDHEYDLLRERERKSGVAYRIAVATEFIVAALSLAVLAFLVYLVRRSLVERSQAAARAQEQLERQVQERTAELQATEERFRLLVEGTKDYAIFMLDPGGHIVTWNGGAERIKGYQAHEIIGQHFSRFYPAEDVQADKPGKELSVAIREGKYEEEGWRVRKNGTTFWASVVITALRDDTGKLRGFSKVIRDITERKQAEENSRRLLQEEAARQAGEQYAQVIERQREQLLVTLSSIGDGVISTDTEGRITLLNPVAEMLTGWTSAEAAGQPLPAVFRVVDAATRQSVENPVATGKAASLENHRLLISRKGAERPIDESAAPIRNRNGDQTGMVLVFRDITQRKQAEEALREEKARLHATLTGIGDAVIVTDAVGKVTMMNPVAQSLTGWKDEAAGRPLEEIFHIINEKSREPVENPVSRVIREGRIIGLANHTILLAKSGAEIPIDDSGAPVRNSEGAIIAVVLVFRDITERKEAERQARQNEASLRFLAEASSSLAAVVDYASTLQKVTRLAVPFFADCCIVDMVEPDGSPRRLAVSYLDPRKGRVADELHRRYPPDPKDDHGPYRVLRTGESELVEEIADATLATIARDEEHLRMLQDLGMKSYMCVPIKAAEKILGVLAFVTAESGRCYNPGDLQLAQDLAHRAGIAVENARLYGELKDADRRKNEFLATLSHELRNPLAPIMNAVELIRLANGDPSLTEQARGLMQRQVDQLVRLVDDLLDMSRISRGRLQLRKERVKLADVIGNAVEAVDPFIKAQNHRLTVSLPQQPIFLNADPTRLAQVVSNLLNNAAKYTEKGGQIRLHAEKQGDQAVIAISDNGIGIAREHLPHVFEMFSQVAPALERSQGGLGLGLALVRELIGLHGGNVEARSDGTGKGSEFIVRLPVAEAFVGQETSASPTSMKRTDEPHKLRVLVVDDNRDTANTLAQILKFGGHETRAAYDGTEAIEAATSFRPDVVFLDIGLPKMNGHEVARHIRGQSWGKSMVLVAVSGWGQVADKKRAMESGFDHHLTKPVKAVDLERLLANML